MAKPDFTLSIKERDGEARNNQAGAAWQNSDGSISLVLRPGVSMSYRDQDKLMFRLWPVKEDGTPQGTARPTSTGGGPGNDDIPF